MRFAAVIFSITGALIATGAARTVQQAPSPTAVSVVRLPEGALQPRVVVDDRGAAHVLYYKGEAAAGDLFYSRLDASGALSAPDRVNAQPGSAIAVGNIRGASLAIGRNQRVHIAWNGSSRATPRAAGDATPMLYTRMNAQGTGFEPERNVLQSAVGLDGGGTVAADGSGRVYIAWHAGGPASKGEGDRRVWLAASTDDGATFSPEKAVSPAVMGACGCCGMASLVDRRGDLFLTYRAAREVVNRDAMLLVSRDRGLSFRADSLERWNIGACPMSGFALAESPAVVVVAWETAGAVSFTTIAPETGARGSVVAPPGTAGARKHPAVAVNAKGEVLLVWTDGVAWQRGGALEWRVFDANGRPTTVTGRRDGVPMWSLVAAYAKPDGSFVIVY